ncbi:MAG: endolytic transglycosylase MltG [Alphaproteobacteria bacterium]|nr:endolytic transglycosylase MltG [Alphaproteobacteria bacterium]
MIRKSFFIYMLIAFITAGLIGSSVFSTYEFFISEGPLEKRTEVFIEKGFSLKKIASYLHKQGIIESPAIFTLGVRVSNKSSELKAGEYSIPARASAKMVMDILTGGKTFIRRITIPEGLTSYQIVELLNKTDSLSGQIKTIPAEGSLLPETYYYSAGDSKQHLIDRMTNAMNRTIDKLWETRQKDLILKSKEDVIILASIIEKETSKDDERAHIASVFLNRLSQKMRLQSDPTVIYGLSDKTGIFKRKLWSNDLKKKHPFNTYIIYGLPPTAISNPGKDSIAAVLNPQKTEDLYFVADGTGGHTFAPSYKEHQENVQQWRQIKKNKVSKTTAKALPKMKRLEIPTPPVLKDVKEEVNKTQENEKKALQ